MYRIEYLQFNELKQEVMSEEDTLQNIIDIWLDCKPNKERKKYLTNAEEWAKYAFESNEHYVMTIFKDEGIFAFIEVYPRTINIKFIDSYQGKYIFPLFFADKILETIKQYAIDKKVEIIDDITAIFK